MEATSNSLIIIIMTVVAVVAVFITPIIEMSHRNDIKATSTIQSAAQDFVNTVSTLGMITQDNYENFIETIYSTGNVYEVSISLQYIDENPYKKASGDINELMKVGENVYYTEYTTQIERALENAEDGKLKLNEGSIVSVEIKNANVTQYEEYISALFGIVANRKGSISASASTLVSTPGDGKIATQN